MYDGFCSHTSSVLDVASTYPLQWRADTSVANRTNKGVLGIADLLCVAIDSFVDEALTSARIGSHTASLLAPDPHQHLVRMVDSVRGARHMASVAARTTGGVAGEGQTLRQQRMAKMKQADASTNHL